MKGKIVRNWICLIAGLIVLAVLSTNFVPTTTPEQVSTPYVITYYYKPSCPACRKLDPTIDMLEDKYSECVTIRRVDISYKRPRHPITGVPATILETSEGKMVGSWAGAQPTESYTEVLDQKCRKENHG